MQNVCLRALAGVALCLSSVFVSVADGATFLPGDILVADSVANAIIKIDPVTGVQTIVASGGFIDQPRSVLLDGGHNMFIGDAFGRLIRIPRGGGPQELITDLDGNAAILDMALDAQGDMIAAVGHVTPGPTIRRINITSGDDTNIRTYNPTDILTGLALGTGGNIFVTEEANFDAVFTVDPGDGTQMTVSSGDNFTSPRDLVFETATDLLVIDSDGQLIRVDVGTGVQTVVFSSLGLGTPQSLALELDGSVLIGDSGGDTIWRLDPTYTNLTALSVGGNLGNPQNLFVVPIPEPTTAWPVVLGVVWLSMRRRRRRQLA